MTSQPTKDRKAASVRLSEWRRQTAARIVAGLGATAAALVSLAYASYSLSRPTEIAQISVNQPIDAGRWRVSVIGARYSKADANATFYLDRKNTVKLDLRFTNLSRESDSSFGRVVQMEPKLAELGEPTFKLARDGSIAGSLHPNMAEVVTAYWTFPDNAKPPASLSLVVKGEFFKPRDNLYAAPGWFPSATVGKLTLPVAGAPL